MSSAQSAVTDSMETAYADEPGDPNADRQVGRNAVLLLAFRAGQGDTVRGDTATIHQVTPTPACGNRRRDGRATRANDRDPDGGGGRRSATRVRRLARRARRTGAGRV